MAADGQAQPLWPDELPSVEDDAAALEQAAATAGEAGEAGVAAVLAGRPTEHLRAVLQLLATSASGQAADDGEGRARRRDGGKAGDPPPPPEALVRRHGSLRAVWGVFGPGRTPAGLAAQRVAAAVRGVGHSHGRLVRAVVRARNGGLMGDVKAAYFSRSGERLHDRIRAEAHGSYGRCLVEVVGP
ncbi:hypothetical protein HK405_002337 [Cladochytrium tenue]|nr:hypothetical protein HK405_002337 [Cladochytrium tenue]